MHRQVRPDRLGKPTLHRKAPDRQMHGRSSMVGHMAYDASKNSKLEVRMQINSDQRLLYQRAFQEITHWNLKPALRRSNVRKTQWARSKVRKTQWARYLIPVSWYKRKLAKFTAHCTHTSKINRSWYVLKYVWKAKVIAQVAHSEEFELALLG